MSSSARQPFRRYVAIGDSSTEGLEDKYPDGSYRGWADRLAEHIANTQDEVLEYANLAVRGLRLNEIRNTQFDDALALKPDLMTIFGGVNDVLVPAHDLAGIRADYEAMFSEATDAGITVLTFTVPDPSAYNPFGKRLKDKLFKLNDIIRSVADRYGALVVDFEHHPIAEDPRLWFEDRLHGNQLGHEKVAAALAWRLGLPGFDESWEAEPEGELVQLGPATSLVSDFDWVVHYLAPWLGRGIRGIPHGLGITAKRPVPTPVERTGSPAIRDA
ncbi:SGNH/GDSL hydrolase family protein [Microlunatus ginsengisoli]|uniref:SGNH/GDSL hydrolase family protein n=1 Tax=Microlunatus ginsengisoli TaxID=363863 RepID=A0ABP7AC51_9ACTN